MLIFATGSTLDGVVEILAVAVASFGSWRPLLSTLSSAEAGHQSTVLRHEVVLAHGCSTTGFEQIHDILSWSVRTSPD